MNNKPSNIITKINAQAGVLELSITGVIYYGWTASDFSYEVDRAIKQGITTATVYLNTQDGSVYEATEIVNQLKRMSSVTVTAGALVASAGTYIMAHFPAKAYKSSQFMIHKPITDFYGNIDQLKAEEKHLENLTTQYREVYASRFSKTPEEIDQLWQQDYWLNASEAKELGLITEITDGDPEITTETIAMMQACGCKQLPQLNVVTNPKIITPMDKNELISPTERTTHIATLLNELKNTQQPITLTDHHRKVTETDESWIREDHFIKITITPKPQQLCEKTPF